MSTPTGWLRLAGCLFGLSITFLCAVPTGAQERENERRPGATTVEPSLGLAVTVASVGLLVPWALSEYRRDKPWTAISPRSWWNGMTEGFAWDDNELWVNHVKHPYQGHLYFTGARANGYGYWSALLFSAVGSYAWECCMETHVASIPDMVTTPLGGAALGESLYRISSLSLDNTATGSERVLREVVAAMINPPRGFSRIVTGRAWRAGENRTDSGDHWPTRLEGLVKVGGRYVGPDPARSSAPTHFFFGLDLTSGDLFRSGGDPFDYYRARVRLDFDNAPQFGVIEVRGSLWNRVLSDSGAGSSALVVFQDFDWLQNSAYRFAGQSVSGSWVVRKSLSGRVELRAHADASVMLLGSTNSEYAAFAEIGGIRERVRLYDFGIGPGGRAEATLMRDGRLWFEALYRFQYLGTLNGSNIAGTKSGHTMQWLRIRAHQPIFAAVAVGVDVNVYWQASHYDVAHFSDTYQRLNEVLLYFSWSPTLR